MSFGSAFIRPSARPNISAIDASTRRSTLSIKESTMKRIVSTIVGINSGSASAIPVAICKMICTAASSRAGRFSIIASASFMIIGRPVSISFGRLSIIAFAKLSTISTPASSNFGAASVIFFTSSSTPSLILSNPFLSPETSIETPSIILVRDGRNSAMSAFLAPVMVLCILVRASSKSALALTASPDMIMPYWLACSISPFVASADWLKSGARFCPDLPNRSLARAARSVESAMP